MAQTLGTVAVGTVVKINESGSPVNYIVVNQGLPSAMYDASCNGTWVLRQDIYENAVWDAGNSNVLPGADIFTTMAEMLSLYDQFIQDAIQTVKIPYCVGGGSSTVRSGANGLQCQIFPLGVYELGFTTEDYIYMPVDGAKLQYFNSGSDRKSNAQNWTRSQNTTNSTNVFIILTGGSYSAGGVVTREYGIRPTFVLSQNLYVWDDGTVSNLPSSGPSSITVPSISMQTQPITVSWASVSNADSYVLQRNADNGGWTQVYAGPLTTFTDTAGSWSTVQYQVCGVFSGTNGAFAQSDVITVVAASALVISGQDGNLGTIVNDIPYSINTDTGNPVTLVRTVNGAQVASATVQNGFSYNIPVLDLPTGTNTIVITATVTASSGQVTATRTWTYTKAAASFPTSGGVAALSQDGQPIFPQTLAEAVKAIGGPWGGNMSTALDKLALAATYSSQTLAKYTEVNVNLATAQSGDIVDLPVNGVMVPHIVVQVGNPDPEMYDSSCDGVWLLRQDIVENGQWNSTNVNTLAGSTIMTTMQGYVTDYDSTVQAAIQTVKIPYCVGNGNTTVNDMTNGLECKIFPLGVYELGWTTSDSDYFPIDGAPLSYFNGADNSKRIALMGGLAKPWYTRSCASGSGLTTGVWYVSNSGNYSSVNASSSSNGLRPCFLLPTTFTATYYVDTAGNVYPSQEYTTAGDFYDLWGNVIPTVKIATGSYVGTGTYGSGNPNTLAFPFEFKVLFIAQNWNTDNAGWHGTFFINGQTQSNGIGYTSSGAESANITISYPENGISWYSSANAAYQFNATGYTYYYVAIG